MGRSLSDGRDGFIAADLIVFVVLVVFDRAGPWTE
jgi:hypothetical protein